MFSGQPETALNMVLVDVGFAMPAAAAVINSANVTMGLWRLRPSDRTREWDFSGFGFDWFMYV